MGGDQRNGGGIGGGEKLRPENRVRDEPQRQKMLSTKQVLEELEHTHIQTAEISVDKVT